MYVAPNERTFAEMQRWNKIIGKTYFQKNENNVNHYLKFVEWIKIDQTFRELPADKAQIIIDRPSDFMAAVAKHIANNE